MQQLPSTTTLRGHLTRRTVAGHLLEADIWGYIWKTLTVLRLCSFFKCCRKPQQTFLSSPPPSASSSSSCSVKPFPIRLISTPSLSHIFTSVGSLTSRKTRHAAIKPLGSRDHGVNRRPSMVYISSVLFNGGDSETNEQLSQNKRWLRQRHQSSGPASALIG